MPFKVISIPISGDAAANEELNEFLRSHKILYVERQLVQTAGGAAWAFCIEYLEDLSPQNKGKEKVDYRQILDQESFKRYLTLRDWRREVAEKENVPAFAIFTNDELAELAKFKNLTPADMKSVKGIGEKKVEKYGQQILEVLKKHHEKGEQTDTGHRRP